MKRQRILYLNAASRSLRAPVVGFAVHEPVESDPPQIEVGVEIPYETVHSAILDGWRIVSFPAQRADGGEEHVDPTTVTGNRLRCPRVAQADEGAPTEAQAGRCPRCTGR